MMARPHSFRLLRPPARVVREWLLHAYRPIHARRRLLRDRQIVFILGHMRSGSSMLTRVLCSHPEVCGNGELHRVYSTERRLEDLAIWLRWHDADKLYRARFLLDKILHDRLLPDADVLRRIGARCIFLIREPDSSIRSMVTRLQRLPVYQRPDLATDYYQARLRRLTEYAAAVPTSHAFFVDYHDLTHRTDEALDRLTRFVGLSSPLSPRYEIDEHGARANRGDRSEHILKGVIHSAKTDYGVEIPEELARRARQAYEQTSSILRERAQTLDQPKTATGSDPTAADSAANERLVGRA